MFYIGQQLLKRLLLHQQVRLLVITDAVNLPLPTVVIGFLLQVKLDDTVRNGPFGRIDIVPEIIKLGKQQIRIALGRDIELTPAAGREVIITLRLREYPQETVQRPYLSLLFANLPPSAFRPSQLVFLAPDEVHLVEHTPHFGEKNHLGLHNLLRLRPGTDIAIELCRYLHHREAVERIAQFIGAFQIVPLVADKPRNRIADRIESRLIIVMPFYMPDTIERTIALEALLLIPPDNQRNRLIGGITRLRNGNQPGQRLHIQPETAEIGLLPIRTHVAVCCAGTGIPICLGCKQHIVGCLETIFLIYLQ